MKRLTVKFVRGVLVLYSKLPLKFHYFMADVLAWFVKNVMRYRADVIYTNLARSFPDMKYWDLEKVADEFYTHLGEIIAEAIWFSGSSYERLRKSGIVTVMNPEEISEMFKSTSNMTILSTHCGNWELLGGFLGYRTPTGAKVEIDERDITVVYKRLHSEVFDEVFALNRVAPLEIVGRECEVESNSILRFAIEHKNERRVYIYPTDQSPYGQSKHPMGMFMHQETYAMLGSAVVASKLGHSVMYMKMKRVERGRYEMSLIPICRDASKMTPDQIMRKYYDLLEEELNETPYNWLWSHKRWK